MKIPYNVDRPLILMTGFIFHQLYFLELLSSACLLKVAESLCLNACSWLSPGFIIRNMMLIVNTKHPFFYCKEYKTLPETLIEMGLFPLTVTKPVSAVHFSVYEIMLRLRTVCKQSEENTSVFYIYQRPNSTKDQILPSVELLEALFKQLSTWKYIFSLSLANKQLYAIASNQTIDLTFIIDSNQTNYSSSIPSKTATKLRFLNSAIYTGDYSIDNDVFFFGLLKTFKKCHYLGTTFEHDIPVQVIEKVCKVVCKNKVYFYIERSPQLEIFQDLIAKYILKYSTKTSLAGDNSSLVGRKRVNNNTVEIRVPKDRKKRQLFYMEQSLEIARDCAQNRVEQADEVGVSFEKVLQQMYTYKRISMEENIFTQLLGKSRTVSQHVEKFINCIVKCNQYSILITSFDLFAHNQSLADDCAFGISSADIFTAPTAKIKSKTNMNKQYKELSIFIGLYELLAVGGYILQNNSIIPFLGSSLGNIISEDFNTNEIYIADVQSPVVNTPRLLNQYLKRCSHNSWGYHSLSSFVQGFYPVVPVDYLNHPSQKHRDLNIYHFASHLLNLTSSSSVLKNEDIKCLWSLVERLAVYNEIIKDKNPKPISFQELAELSSHQKGKYLKSLLAVAAKMEEHVPCYMLSIYKHAEARNICLGLLQDGLKGEIKKQQSIICNKRKTDVN